MRHSSNIYFWILSHTFHRSSKKICADQQQLIFIFALRLNDFFCKTPHAVEAEAREFQGLAKKFVPAEVEKSDFFSNLVLTSNIILWKLLDFVPSDERESHGACTAIDSMKWAFSHFAREYLLTKNTLRIHFCSGKSYNNRKASFPRNEIVMFVIALVKGRKLIYFPD